MLEGVSVFELGCDQRIASAWGGWGCCAAHRRQASSYTDRGGFRASVRQGIGGCGGENKKGPPFGEPFLILRMVPAPGIEPGTY